MAFMLYSIDEAVDCKYIITKAMSGQAKPGTLIHVMDTKENSDGVTVFYRITKTGQNFVAKFETIKDFCKWCTPDSFIAIIDLQPEHLNRPEQVALNFFSHTGQEITVGNNEVSVAVSCLKYETASSIVFLMLKN